MTWLAARTYARAGRRVRREGWQDRWITHHDHFYWLQPVNRATLPDGPERVVEAPDFTAAEFLADDWTFAPIPLPAGGGVPLASFHFSLAVLFDVGLADYLARAQVNGSEGDSRITHARLLASLPFSDEELLKGDFDLTSSEPVIEFRVWFDQLAGGIHPPPVNSVGVTNTGELPIIVNSVLLAPGDQTYLYISDPGEAFAQTLLVELAG